MKMVKNMNTLRAMQKAELIKFCEQTGEIIETLYSNKKHRCYYIDEAVGSNSFDFKNKKYRVKYLDGCFFPFVFEIEENSTEKPSIYIGL